MNYIWHYEVSAAVLTAIVFFICFIRRPFLTQAWRIFLAALGLNMVASISDVVAVLPLGLPVWGLWASNLIYQLSLNLSIAVAYWYLLGVTRNWQFTAADKIIWSLFLAVGSIPVLISPMTGLVFSISPEGEYAQGPLMPLMYLVDTAIVLYNLFVYFQCRKNMLPIRRVTLMIYESVSVLTLLVDLILPEYLLSGFVIACLLMMVFALLENPEFYLFHDTYCYNERALAYALQYMIRRGSKFQLIAVLFDETDYLHRLLAAQTDSIFVRTVSGVLNSLFQRRQVYAISRDRCVILLDEHASLEQSIARIRTVFQKGIPIGKTNVSATPSFGTLSCPSAVNNTEEIMNALPVLFHQLRRQPPDQMLTFTREMIANTRRSEMISFAVQHAIQENSLQLRIQPIYDVNHRAFLTAEVKVRLADERMQDVTTKEIITAAEKTGQILVMGEQILEKVFGFWQRTRPELLGLRYLEINLSVVQGIQSELADQIEALAVRRGISLSHFNFGIMDTASLNNEENLSQNMKKLLKTGASFSMDGFGTGYANITHLARFPFSLIKLDRSMLLEAARDRDSLAILRNTISLLKDLHKLVTVEGVDSAAMKEILDQLPCDYYQGLCFSHPLTEEEFIRFLQEHQE